MIILFLKDTFDNIFFTFYINKKALNFIIFHFTIIRIKNQISKIYKK
jgi:hypothetical protein